MYGHYACVPMYVCVCANSCVPMYAMFMCRLVCMYIISKAFLGAVKL